MTNTANNAPAVDEISEEQRQQWLRAQYQHACKYLADKGIVTNSVMVEDSRYIAPIVSVWKLKTINNKWLWVISGDLPSDHVNIEVANNAQDVLRHFSMKWQLQAENINRNNASDEQQKNYAQLLISRADGLYKLSHEDALWSNNG